MTAINMCLRGNGLKNQHFPGVQWRVSARHFECWLYSHKNPPSQKKPHSGTHYPLPVDYYLPLKRSNGFSYHQPNGPAKNQHDENGECSRILSSPLLDSIAERFWWEMKKKSSWALSDTPHDHCHHSLIIRPMSFQSILQPHEYIAMMIIKTVFLFFAFNVARK